jgi:hypothetical protein
MLNAACRRRDATAAHRGWPHPRFLRETTQFRARVVAAQNDGRRA